MIRISRFNIYLLLMFLLFTLNSSLGSNAINNLIKQIKNNEKFNIKSLNDYYINKKEGYRYIVPYCISLMYYHNNFPSLNLEYKNDFISNEYQINFKFKYGISENSIKYKYNICLQLLEESEMNFNKDFILKNLTRDSIIKFKKQVLDKIHDEYCFYLENLDKTRYEEIMSDNKKFNHIKGGLAISYFFKALLNLKYHNLMNYSYVDFKSDYIENCILKYNQSDYSETFCINKKLIDSIYRITINRKYQIDYNAVQKKSYNDYIIQVDFINKYKDSTSTNFVLDKLVNNLLIENDPEKFKYFIDNLEYNKYSKFILINYLLITNDTSYLNYYVKANNLKIDFVNLFEFFNEKITYEFDKLYEYKFGEKILSDLSFVSVYNSNFNFTKDIKNSKTILINISFDEFNNIDKELIHFKNLYKNYICFYFNKIFLYNDILISKHDLSFIRNKDYLNELKLTFFEKSNQTINETTYIFDEYHVDNNVIKLLPKDVDITLKSQEIKKFKNDKLISKNIIEQANEFNEEKNYTEIYNYKGLDTVDVLIYQNNNLEDKKMYIMRDNLVMKKYNYSKYSGGVTLINEYEYDEFKRLKTFIYHNQKLRLKGINVYSSSESKFPKYTDFYSSSNSGVNYSLHESKYRDDRYENTQDKAVKTIQENKEVILLYDSNHILRSCIEKITL